MVVLYTDPEGYSEDIYIYIFFCLFFWHESLPCRFLLE